MKLNTLSLFSTPVLHAKFDEHSKYVDKFDNWGEIDRKPNHGMYH